MACPDSQLIYQDVLKKLGKAHTDGEEKAVPEVYRELKCHLPGMRDRGSLIHRWGQGSTGA